MRSCLPSLQATLILGCLDVSATYVCDPIFNTNSRADLLSAYFSAIALIRRIFVSRNVYLMKGLLTYNLLFKINEQISPVRNPFRDMLQCV